MLNGVVSERDDLRIAGGILRVSDTGSRYENCPLLFLQFGSVRWWCGFCGTSRLC